VKILFSIIGFLTYFFGFVIFSTANGAIHEILGLMLFLNGTIFFVGAGIIRAVEKNSIKPSN
jgi:hypothetical protein